MNNDAQLNDKLGRFTIFTFMWGMFLLLHMLMTHQIWLASVDKIETWLASLSLLSAFFLVLAPASLSCFCLAVSSHLIYEIYTMPTLPNHIFLSMFMELTALGISSSDFFFIAESKKRKAAIYQKLRAFLGLEIMLMYFFVVFHKLNWDFFDQDVSCGALFYQDIVAYIAIIPNFTWFHFYAACAALLSEIAIPILLIFPSTRLVGILLGASFHLMLALHPNNYVYSYTALMLASFSLFLPNGFWNKLHNAWQKSSWKDTQGNIVLLLVLCLATLISVYLSMMVKGIAFGDTTAELASRYLLRANRIALYLLGGFSIAAFIYITWKKDKKISLYYPTARAFFKPANSPLLILPALMILNGFSPYFGLKTTTVWSMFSNLHTENKYTNHMLMPVNYRLAVYQDDLIEILETNDPTLQSYIDHNMLITAFELRRYFNNNAQAEINVRFNRNGREYTINDSRANHEDINDILEPIPLWQKALLRFRPVSKEKSKTPCTH